jgi:hypothetical protein
MSFGGVFLRQFGLLVGGEVIALSVRGGGLQMGLGGEVVELDGAFSRGVGHGVLAPYRLTVGCEGRPMSRSGAHLKPTR